MHLIRPKYVSIGSKSFKMISDDRSGMFYVPARTDKDVKSTYEMRSSSLALW